MIARRKEKTQENRKKLLALLHRVRQRRRRASNQESTLNVASNVARLAADGDDDGVDVYDGANGKRNTPRDGARRGAERQRES